MKPFLALVAFLVCGTLCSPDDAADAKANTMAALAACNAGDANNFVTHFLPDVNGFFFDGSPLSEGMDKKALKALYDASFKPNLEARQYAVKLHGNTAIVTAYFVGSLTWPGGGGPEGQLAVFREANQAGRSVEDCALPPFPVGCRAALDIEAL